MTKKSTWLPGQSNVYGDDEPSLKSNRNGGVRWGNWAATPLGDFIFSGVILILAVAVAVWVFGPGAAPLDAGGSYVLLGLIAIALIAVVLRTVRSIRRIIWRKNNTALTGGVYLRAWQRTPKQYADRIIER